MYVESRRTFSQKFQAFALTLTDSASGSHWRPPAMARNGGDLNDTRPDNTSPRTA
jgi:hypothetical protein